MLKCVALHRRFAFAFSSSARPKLKPIKYWTIVRGDYVKVTSGPDKDKVGEVLKVFRKKQQLLVAGVNTVRIYLIIQGSQRSGGRGWWNPHEDCFG